MQNKPKERELIRGHFKSLSAARIKWWNFLKTRILEPSHRNTDVKSLELELEVCILKEKHLS